MKKIKQYISVWNINSYGEYFLQIANLYKKDYVNACNKICEERKLFINDLRKIKGIKVYDSQANYILCDLKENSSDLVSLKLLEKNIFIKDLRTKDAYKNKNFIRLAIRTREENKILVEELKKALK